MWRPLAAAGLLAVAACTTPIEQSINPAAGDHKVTRVAVVPLTFEPFSPRDVLTEQDAKAASKVVTARVAEALIEWSQLEAVPPGDVGLWLRDAPSVSAPAEVGAALHSAFGVDALLTGQVRRYHAREGGPRGATRPASVRFELELRTPGGVLLWEGVYNEAQSSITADLGSLGRASERGFRWVTAEALTRYGARELMRELAGHSAAWK
jgi:hypothetical protein